MNHYDILFYKIYNKEDKSYYPYYEFSNFSSFWFNEDQHLYKTSEHYYQSKKARLYSGDEQRIIKAKTPHEAAQLGRSIIIRSDWEYIKVDIMYRALQLKFNSWPNLKSLLLNTKGKTIAENSPKDYFWGIGKDGTGKNMLGELLMKLRTELEEEE